MSYTAVPVWQPESQNFSHDGTLDNPQSGTLEVYKNNRILMKQACRKS
nr:hypothetical protein [Nostoc punctiforme]